MRTSSPRSDRAGKVAVMTHFDSQTLEAELHQFELRFERLRLRQPQLVDRLVRSIEQDGQLVPVVAVADSANQWVLVDGYLRIEALRRLARDTAWVELSDCPLPQALLVILVRGQARRWQALEEAAVIQELTTRFGLSQREVARQTGRDVSWVNRRLSLVQELPETLFMAICQGELSTWAATRVLAPEHGIHIAYSTLTRWVREANWRAPKQRAGSYSFDMGEEMQFDTSPHRLKLNDQPIKAQCASLVLAYSRRLFICYFPCFTRFEAKAFLHEALCFMDGSARRCMIDNTNVVVVSGSGADAVMAPEMVAFGQIFGFEFVAHAIGDANRSARVERPFYYVEKNFLSGRRFDSWDDLNAQARSWCERTANQKPKRALGMSPEAAYVLEKPQLRPLPSHLPPVYQAFTRIVDVEGYVYWQIPIGTLCPNDCWGRKSRCSNIHNR